MRSRIFKQGVRQGLILGIATFFLAMLINLSSHSILKLLGPLTPKFILLVVIISIGVVFDIIGMAAAAAKEKTFHAKASKKILGGRQCVNLVRRADQVAAFCNDVVGDISGTLSGAIGAAIVFELITTNAVSNKVFAGTVMTAAVAALTVGGKAFGKSLAIEYADDIIFRVGMLIAVVEKTLGITIIKSCNKKKGRK